LNLGSLSLKSVRWMCTLEVDYGLM
jgi:hypothetical protein